MKNILSFLIVLFYSISCFSQIRGEEINVMVSPDHADWNYQLGEKCTFTVRVLKANNLLPDVVIDYELGPEMYPVEKKSGVKLKDGKITLTGKMNTPGFFMCKVSTTVKGRKYEGLANAAYEPLKLKPVTVMPKDFTSFWTECISKAREVPFDYKMKLLPDRCTETVNVYEVSFQNNRYGSRIYGILTMPVKEGKYPALLRVPGAGVRPYQGDTYIASKGAIVLEIGIHGVSVTQEQKMYDDLQNGPLNGYWTFNAHDRYNCYYNRVITGVIRSIDFIECLPQFNREQLGITGASQGGALSIIGAALDSRITFYAAIHPALCDHTAFLKKRAGGWPHYLYYNSDPSDELIKNIRYYDTANFATLLKVPGWFSFGYNDVVCPPTSVYSAYNVITAPKEVHTYLQTGHYWYQEQYDEWNNWLLKMLEVQ